MLIVKKFGGTSLVNINRVKIVANIIADAIMRKESIIAVVSAPAGMTDKLLNDANNILESKLLHTQLSDDYLKEYDNLLASGEQINAALLALALKAQNLEAMSCNAFMLPIYGYGPHMDGNISEINKDSLKDLLGQNIVPVIAGFQAISRDGHSFYTLGRGGSDYSAVMIAASLNADYCDIYTDVDGIYTADPRIIKNAKHIAHMTYEDALVITDVGAKVLQNKSVICAKQYNVSVNVLSSFDIDQSNAKKTVIGNASIISSMSNYKRADFAMAWKNSDDCAYIVSIIYLAKKMPNGLVDQIEKILSSYEVCTEGISYDNDTGKIRFKIILDESNQVAIEMLNEIYNFLL